MIEPEQLCGILSDNQIDFYCGVPDSLLKNLCAYIDDNLASDRHVITANEGNAVALAAGHYLGSGSPAVVYMQNSGLGNSINPLVSLADEQVYAVPMLLVIGWRGEPGVKDEPQHIKQGQITEAQLEVLGIPYQIVDPTSNITELLPPLLETMHDQSRPVALLVKKGTFASHATQKSPNHDASLGRESALDVILDAISADSLVVSTTGKTSRELYELRKKKGQECKDFLMVGGMGHASSVAMGVAMTNPKRKVVLLDGDGALLMHMGALPVLAANISNNFLHILLNNHCHESVGGQPTVAGKIDLQSISLGCGYKSYLCVENADELNTVLTEIHDLQGPVMLEIKIAAGSREDLGRPESTPLENKAMFEQQVRGTTE